MPGERILIVEDYEKNRKLERDILQFHGYRTVEADAAEKGIRLAQATPPALVLMDIQLPGMDGIEALQHLRADPRTRAIPVIAVTASVMTPPHLSDAGGSADRTMHRRAFIGALAGGLLAAPLAAEGQQAGKVYRIGWLEFGPTVGSDSPPPEFVRQLEELGWVRGQNLAIEIRGHQDQARLPALARELLHLGVDLIVANGTVAAQAAKSVTPTLPIVFLISADPIGSGLVMSLARPGGNVTGPSISSFEFAPKRLELFKAAIPRLKHIAVLGSLTGISAKAVREIEAVAPVGGVQVRRFMARGAEDFEDVFAAIRKERLDGLLVVNSPEFIAARARLAELALLARLPTMFEEWRFVEEGGLIAYGPSYPDIFRRAAIYVDKILKGAKPGDLPVEQPTKFELVINLKTAKALGVTIPPSLLQRADQVIE